MSYNFDLPIERRGTDCVKYDGLGHFFGRDDLLPMWVADMDFLSPDFVVRAIRERLEHEVLGYHFPSKYWSEAIIAWLAERYSIEANTCELHFIPGIVAGISFVVQAFTQLGDKVLVTTPVYPPFLTVPAACGRQIVQCPLTIVSESIDCQDARTSRGMNQFGKFKIDFDIFERYAEGCKILILSNPHNPGGTVWSPDDLRRIAEICHRYGLLVISDEIHADLTLPSFYHTSFPTVSQTARDISIMFMAPSKTFNIAGLGSSVSYIHNADIRRQFHAWLDGNGVAGGNIFAYVGAEAAFRDGREWLSQMLQYLDGNVTFTRRFLSENMPRVKAVLPQASYLVWLDFSDYGFSNDEVARRLYDVAHVALNDGRTFGGDAYASCFRLNIGCPRSMLLDALTKIRDAFNG